MDARPGGVPAIAHGHHEKLDGSGYPMGLRGPQISVQTRILTICDIWDALTAGDRPYKKAVPVEQALDLMREECDAGHIDGSLFQVFVESPGRGRRMMMRAHENPAHSHLRRRPRCCCPPAPTSACGPTRRRRRRPRPHGRIRPTCRSPGRNDRPRLVARLRRPHLDQLVDRAIAGNVDLSVLAARIGVANAQIGEARAGALPTLEAGAGASFEKSTGQKFTKQFNLATQTNWDIDIWGKVEKGVQAQKAEFSATEADWRAGYLKLVSDVSTTYFQILQFDEQIDQQQKPWKRTGKSWRPTRRCSRTA
jgi:hypothetical protein